VLNGNSRFRFGKKNYASLTFSLQNGIQRFRERRGEQRPTAQSAWADDGHLTKQLTHTSHITMNINRIIITGNLVANPTLRETNSGTPVASATIANNEFFSDADGERQQVTTFVDVTVWGKSAENFGSLAQKGQEVIIEGQLRRNDWETEDGQKHSKHFVKAESWQFTQAKAKRHRKPKTTNNPVFPGRSHPFRNP
jgi:single-strand DNA-binding protein